MNEQNLEQDMPSDDGEFEPFDMEPLPDIQLDWLQKATGDEPPQPTQETSRASEGLSEAGGIQQTTSEKEEESFTGWLTTLEAGGSEAGADEAVESFDWLTAMESEPIQPLDSEIGQEAPTDLPETSHESTSLSGVKDTQQEVSEEEGESFTGWLTALEADAPEAEASEAAESFDWLTDIEEPIPSQPLDSEADQEVLTNLGDLSGEEGIVRNREDQIPDWLMAMRPEGVESAPPADSLAGEENDLINWLDESAFDETDDAEETSFTNWLSDPQSDPEGTEMVEDTRLDMEPNETPAWLTEKEGWAATESTGFTDWLSESGGDDDFVDDEDDDLTWMDEAPLPEDLLTPLSTEEAQKLLAETPSVSEDFIETAAEKDFPDWFDVKEEDYDPDETIVPDWISAPLTQSDELKVGLGRDDPMVASPLEDDWLDEALGDPAIGDQEMAVDSDWLDDMLATSQTENDMDWLDEASADLPDNNNPLATQSVDNDWLDDMLATSQTENNMDWLGEAPDELAASDADDQVEEDWLAELIDMGTPSDEVTADLGGLDDTSLAGLDWFQDDAQATDLDPEPLASAEESEPLESLEEAVPLEVVPESELDPALSLDDFEYSEEPDPADEGELDWLAVLDEADSLMGDEVIAKQQIEPEEPTQAEAPEDVGPEDTGIVETIAEESTPLPDPLPLVEEASVEPSNFFMEETTSDTDLSDTDLEDTEVESGDFIRELRALGTRGHSEPETTLQGASAVAEEPLLWEDIDAEAEPVLLEAPTWIDPLDDSPAVTGEAETGGPLDGLRGVIPIAAAITTLRTDRAMRARATSLVTTTEQTQQTELLRQLGRLNLDDELLLSDSATSARPRLVTAMRLVLGLCLLVAIVVGLSFPNLIPTNPPPLSAEVAQFYTTLTALQSDRVLVAFEYSPAYSAELSAQADLVLSALNANDNDILVMSQYPTGLINAAPVYTRFNNVTDLGYIPGEALGLRELATCLQNNTPCLTTVGRSLPIDNVAAIVVFTAERDSLVNWMEQVEPQTTAPLLFGVTQGLAPVARSYVSSQQIAGLMGGLVDVAAYERAYASPSANMAIYQAQTIAKILSVAVLLIGAIGYTIWGRIKR